MWAVRSILGCDVNGDYDHTKPSQSTRSACLSMICAGPYASAREDLLQFLKSSGFKPHPLEVFCPSSRHCWVDVAAAKGSDLWAFEYKSRSDSIRTGLEQCQSYASAFNCVVLVADRHRITSSPYFSKFKQEGFGVWGHKQGGFYSIVAPERRYVASTARRVIERQFGSLLKPTRVDRNILDWCGQVNRPLSNCAKS